MRRLLPFVVLAALAACERAAPPALPDVKLPNLASHREFSLASCPTPKCLTVYLAPWCGYCRAYTPHILELRRFLNGKGVTTRVVIGKDGPAEVRDYAKVFGKDTLLDDDGAMAVGGVPNFTVSDPAGKVLRNVAGVPTGAQNVEEFAAAFGLP